MCAAPLMRKLRVHFLKMRVRLDGTANRHHAVAANALSEPNFVIGFGANTKGVLQSV